jgi:hypothetical protein
LVRFSVSIAGAVILLFFSNERHTVNPQTPCLCTTLQYWLVLKHWFPATAEMSYNS